PELARKWLQQLAKSLHFRYRAAKVEGSVLRTRRYLIPIKTINEHLQLLFFQSAYILAIDNFMNLWSRTPTIIQSIAGFIAKNIISALVNGSIDNSSKSKIYSITSYCYSIKIKL
ncbi:MAG: hypothetical protein ABSF32_11920, partial [Ignavibacteria bacterium]